MNEILTGSAITAGIDATALGLEFATVEAGTYPIGEDAGYALAPQQWEVEEPYGVQTTQFTNTHLGTALEQLGPKNAVLMGALSDGTMKLLARGTEEEINGMSLHEIKRAVEESVTLADLRGLEGGFAAFNMEAFLANAIERGPVVIKARYDLIEDEERREKFIGPQKPAVLISWEEAKALALLLGDDLLKEEEWEIAARGKEKRDYATAINKPQDDSGKKLGNFGEDWGTGSTVAVGSYPPVQIGGVNVYDLLGNVWEWTESSYSAGGESRVLRGGSWFNVGDVLRAACRGRGGPDGRNNDVGFRLRRAASPVTPSIV